MLDYHYFLFSSIYCMLDKRAILIEYSYIFCNTVRQAAITPNYINVLHTLPIIIAHISFNHLILFINCIPNRHVYVL